MKRKRKRATIADASALLVDCEKKQASHQQLLVLLLVHDSERRSGEDEMR
jgi:hypothetical protein